MGTAILRFRREPEQTGSVQIAGRESALSCSFRGDSTRPQNEGVGQIPLKMKRSPAVRDLIDSSRRLRLNK